MPAAETSANFRGWDKIDRKLRDLPGRVAQKAVRSGTREAAKPALKIARAKVRVRTGALKKAIVLTPAPRANTELKRRGVYTVRIGINSKTRVFIPNASGTGATMQRPVRYAHHEEFGNRNKAASPFLRPAYNAGKRRFAAEAGQNIGAATEKEIAKS